MTHVDDRSGTHAQPLIGRLVPRARLPGNFRMMLATDIDSATASAAAAGGAEKRAYVKQIFSEIAPRYDLLNHVLSLNIDRRWRRMAIAKLGVERDKGGLYLDLCAGTLDVAAELSRLPGFRGMVIGADFAEPMLRAGASKLGTCARKASGRAGGHHRGVRPRSDVDAPPARLLGRMLGRRVCGERHGGSGSP